MYNIILVHIGEFFYEHINDCIEQLLNYGNENIHILISRNHISKIKHNIKIICLEDIEATEEHIYFSKNTRLDPNFRGGFWKFASERLYYINDFMQKTKLENVIHLENDNLLYFNVKDYIEIFENNYKIGVTFDNDVRCIPGFMFIKKSEYMQNLIKFIMNSNKDDMHIVSDYRYISNEISQLPIIYNNYEDVRNIIHHNVIVRDFNSYSNNFDKFQSIFDAACIGQYLGGIDPRNKIGDTTGFINEGCVFDPSRLNIIFERNDKGLNEPFIIKNNKKIKINSLHMHCKNLKKFK